MIRRDRPPAPPPAEAPEPAPELGRAALALGTLAAAGIAEGAFRRLRSATLERVDPAAADVPGGAEAVAAWIALPRLPEVWTLAVVAGGLLGALPVFLARRADALAPRPSVVTGGNALLRVAVTACLALLAWVGLGTGSLERMRTPDGGAMLLVACAASTLSVWVLGPLAARLATPRASWVGLVVCGIAFAAHAGGLAVRNAAPMHPVVRTIAWLAHEPGRVAVEGDVALDEFGALRLGPGARVEGTEGRDAALRAWFIGPEGTREIRAADGRLPALEGPGRLVGARWVREARARSVRSSREARSLVTIAVDGLRTRDVMSLVEGPLGLYDRDLERLLEESLLLPDVVAPTSDPAASEVALLTGMHPAELGRATPTRHLGRALHAAGLRSAAFVREPPRPGVASGFATVVSEPATPWSAARSFLEHHGEERFHLHLSHRGLTLERLWSSEDDGRLPERPSEPPDPESFVRGVRARVADRAMHAERVGDEPIVSPEWRAWFDARVRHAANRVLFEVAQLHGLLEELGLAERTRFVVVGTAGLALGEHGAFGTGVNLHAESVRVPVLVLGPDLPRGSLAPFATGERRGPTVRGARPLSDLAALLADEMDVPWDGGEPRWWWDDPAPDAPIFQRLAEGEWNGVPGRALYGSRDDEYTVLWCPAAEATPPVLPDAGPWRLFRAEDRAEVTDIALVDRFADDARERLADLRRWAAGAAAARAEAETPLAGWAAHGALSPKSSPRAIPSATDDEEDE